MADDFSLRRIDLHGNEVGYRMAGKGPAVVLVHGLALSSTTWRPVSCTSNGIQSRSHDFGRGGGCGHEACRTMQSATPPCVENMKQLMLPLGLLKCTIAASAALTIMTR